MSADQRVVIVDDHRMLAETLALTLRREGHDVELVDFEGASSAEQLVATLVRMHPRIVLLDLDLGEFGDGLPLVEPSISAGADVVVVTDAPDPGRWADALRAGARTVISKSEPLQEVLGTVRKLFDGLPVHSPEERAQLLELWTRQQAEHEVLASRFDSLSPSEVDVLALLVQGHTVADIGARSLVGVETVRSHLRQVLAKLGVSSQRAAVALAYQVGWRPPMTMPRTSRGALGVEVLLGSLEAEREQ